LDTLLESGVYEPVPKDPAAKVERKVQQILTKYKTVLPTEVKRKLTPITASLHTYSQTRHPVETYSEFYRFALPCLGWFPSQDIESFGFFFLKGPVIETSSF
jgi:hypothetical protein